MTGAQKVVQRLKEKGVEIIFGYPGGAIMPIYDALYNSGIEHVLCRHEQGAAIAAIGYSRASAKIGVCMATSGPGTTNLITGLGDAMVDSIPMIAITGQVVSSMIGTDAFQEVDMLGLSLACTKHSFLVESIEQLPSIIDAAFEIATSGRPGPVLIDIPKDVQLAICQQDTQFEQNEAAYVNDIPSITSEQIKQAQSLISQANKPILYIGGGVMLANAVETLRDFMKTTSIPAVSTLKGLGSIDYDYPYDLGMLGMHGSQAANYAVQESDLLIGIGVRFDDRVTGKLDTFAPHAKILHLDIDPAEINKLKRSYLSILGDLNEILPQLTVPTETAPWLQRINELMQHYAVNYDACNTEGIYAPKLLKQLSDKLTVKKENTIITTDVGQHQMWTAQHMHFSHPKNFITSCGFGTMGYGLPSAIGAQQARPDAHVICISGDGSFMMNVQELVTIKRQKLPIKIVLIDNQRLGMVRQWQQIFFDGRYSETNLADNPDFILLAKACGIEGESITHTDEVENALNRLLHSSSAYLLHVAIDSYENVWPLVSPGTCNTNMIMSLNQKEHSL